MRCYLTAAITSTLLTLGAGTLRAQSDCTVETTFAGRADRVGVACTVEGEQRSRDGVVPEQLLACPLLKADRVAVTYENNDPGRQPHITQVLARGGTGANAGDWCARGFAPGVFTGPCEVTEEPPSESRTSTVGESWVRTIINTMFRDTNDNRMSVSPGGCGPVELQPGVSRIYVTETIRRATWVTCANDPARACEQSMTETNRYEGGIYVDAGIEPVEPLTDVSPLVRGWSGAAEAVAADPAAAPWVTADALRMAGAGLGIPLVTTGALRMAGAGTGVALVVTEALRMGGFGTSAGPTGNQ